MTAHSPNPSAERPEVLSIFTALFVIGLEAASLIAEPVQTGMLILALIGALVLIAWPNPGRVALPLLLLTGLGTGIGVQSLHQEARLPVDQLKPFHGASVTVSGVFSGELRLNRQGGYRCRWEDIRGELDGQSFTLPRSLNVEIASAEPFPEPGQQYSATGTLHIERTGLMRLSCQNIEPISEGVWFSRIIGRLQQWVRDGSQRLLSPRHQALNVGLLLGDTSRLSYQDRRLFRETGLTHLLAVSGQHVMVLALLLSAILTWCGVPPLSRGLISIVLLTIFGFMAAGQPSVWRAVVMYAVGLLIWNLESNPGPIRPVALAALLLLIWNPHWIHHIGFQLSFLAVFGIIIGRPPLEHLLTRLHLPLLLARYLAVSLGANLATLPLAAYHFGMVSIVSFLINPLVVWAFGILLPLGIVLVLLGHLWFSGALLVSASLSLAFDAFLAVAEAMSRLPGGLIFTGRIPGSLVALGYAGMLFLLWETRWFQPSECLSTKDSETNAMNVGSASYSEPKFPRTIVPDPMPPANAGTRLTTASTSDDKPLPPHRIPVALIMKIDDRLGSIPRRSLRTSSNLVAITFPVQKLKVESQTIFHRLDDLTPEVLRQEPQRIVQAVSLCLTLISVEILARLPQAVVSDASVWLNGVLPTLQSRHLITILLASRALSDYRHTTDTALNALTVRADELLREGMKLMTEVHEQNREEVVRRHQELRSRTFEWCRTCTADS